MREKVDLEARYAPRITSEQEAEDQQRYRGYLDDFKRIQALLFDEGKVAGYLKLISTPGARENLDAHLATFEGAWAASRPILLAGAGGAFTRIVNRGQMFVDTVAPKHGVHAHRLQWNVIGRDIATVGGYNHTAVELYREASRAWWRVYQAGDTLVDKGLFMWQQILDCFGAPTVDAFTTPDNLTDFIAKHTDPGLADLRAGVETAEATRRKLKEERIRHYVSSEHYTGFKEAFEQSSMAKGAALHDEYLLDGWTYTGFIKGAWTNPPSGVKPEPNQPVPTVAYPPGQSPEERPPE